MMFVDSIFDNLILPIISRKYQAYRIQADFDSAQELLKSQSEGDAAKGLAIVRQLCLDNPINMQEYMDHLCTFVREKAHRNRESLGTWKPVVRSALLLICSLPRYDSKRPKFTVLTSVMGM